VATLDTKRYSPNKLDELLLTPSSSTTIQNPKPKSATEILNDALQNYYQPGKHSDLIDSKSLHADSIQATEDTPNPLDDYFKSTKPSASPNDISETPGVLLTQNSRGFQRYADAIKRKSNTSLVESENRTHNLCMIAADSAEVQTTLAKLSYSKTDLKNAENMLKALASHVVKENNISENSLNVEFYNSASMTDLQLYATVFGQPASKADMKAFYDDKNDTIWINLDKSTGSTQDIIATFANELSHYVDDIKGKEFTNERQKASSNHERKADNLLYEFMGEDTRSGDEIETFKQQSKSLDLVDRNNAAGEVVEAQPAIFTAIGIALTAILLNPVPLETENGNKKATLRMLGTIVCISSGIGITRIIKHSVGFAPVVGSVGTGTAYGGGLGAIAGTANAAYNNEDLVNGAIQGGKQGAIIGALSGPVSLVLNTHKYGTGFMSAFSSMTQTALRASGYVNGVTAIGVGVFTGDWSQTIDASIFFTGGSLAKMNLNPLAKFSERVGRRVARVFDGRYGYKTHVIDEHIDSNGRRVPLETHFNIPNNPTKSPAKGWQWIGGEKGSWHNFVTKQSLRPDLNHPGMKPHWDLQQTKKIRYRVYMDGSYERKK
jgi:hypothetical protein